MALLLREGDVLSLLEMHGNIMVLEQAFGAWAQGNAVNRSRTRIVQDNGVMHLLAIEVRPAPSARQAIEEADIVITATTSPEPVLPGDWLKSGSHINAIGSNWANRRELDFATLQRSRVIVTDSQEQARAEAGDFVIPANERLFDWSKVSDLADVVADHGPKRELASDITLSKGVCIALEDVATAAHVYTLARKRGVGEEINLLQ